MTACASSAVSFFINSYCYFMFGLLSWTGYELLAVMLDPSVLTRGNEGNQNILVALSVCADALGSFCLKSCANTKS